MIFTPENCEKVKKGLKTQTRRIVKPGEYLLTIEQREVSDLVFGANGRTKWQVGRTYAIQPGRGKGAIGHFKLLDIRREGVMDISEEDARAEGVEPLRVFATDELLYKPAFVSLWNEINGTGSFSDNPEVWVLVFEVVEPAQ